MEQAARCRGRRDAGAQVDPDSAPNRVTRGQPFLESSSSLREVAGTVATPSQAIRSHIRLRLVNGISHKGSKLIFQDKCPDLGTLLV